MANGPTVVNPLFHMGIFKFMSAACIQKLPLCYGYIPYILGVLKLFIMGPFGLYEYKILHFKTKPCLKYIYIYIYIDDKVRISEF